MSRLLMNFIICKIGPTAARCLISLTLIFCLSDDALWAKIHLIYFGIGTFYIEEKVIKLYIFLKTHV